MVRRNIKFGAVLALLVIARGAAADAPLEQFQPQFQAYSKDHKIELPIRTSFSAFFSPPISTPGNIRVLIFPHLGAYSLPQGRETKFDEVTFRSVGDCEVYPDSVPPRATQPRVTRTLTVRYNDVKNHRLMVKCPTRTTLQRENGLRSFDYQGTFFVTGKIETNGRPAVQVVQYLPFETYLKGVVPAEMPASWHEEALKAQAIAARSYALYQWQNEKIKARTRDYDLDDTVYYQAYLGLSWMHKNANQAVDETKGLALWYKDNPAKTFFSADSGGYTEVAENVWSSPCGFCVSKPEVYDLNLGPKSWHLTFTLADIEARLRKAKLHSGAATLRSLQIDPNKVNQSGRVMEVELTFSDGNYIRLFGPKFQQLLHMRSNLFTMKNTAGVNGQNQLEFEGRGFGHGVGMNQWGARILARDYGWNYRQILFFYYNFVDLR